MVEINLKNSFCSESSQPFNFDPEESTDEESPRWVDLLAAQKKGSTAGPGPKTEDMILSEYIRIHGDGGWRNLPKKAGESQETKSLVVIC
jgi:hypothetical protein